MEQAAIVDGKVVSASAALTYVLGGKATFTLVSLSTGTRFTYLVQVGKNKKNPTDPDVFFVKLLTGPDNSNDFSYFGFIKNNTFTYGGFKAKVPKDAPSVKGFIWAFAQFVANIMPADKLEFVPASKCARCGRKLTVPVSVHNGFGPECITKVGYGASPAPIAIGSSLNQDVPRDPMQFAIKVSLSSKPNTDHMTPVFEKGKLVVNGMSVNEMVEWKRVNDPEGFTMDGEMEEPEARAFWSKRFRTCPLTPAEMATV